jgi:hypothetical protein
VRKHIAALFFRLDPLPISIAAEILAFRGQSMARENAHKLFGGLVRDLETVCRDYPGKMACPLCLTLFSEDAVDLDEPQLTEEHIIPGELGGEANHAHLQTLQ